jgi:hypothetical protein
MPYIQAVIDLVYRAEKKRIDTGGKPRTIVERKDETTAEITRFIPLDNSPEPFEVFVELKIDDQIEFSALFSGRLGMHISANDVERFVIKLIKLSQNSARLFSLYEWVVSVEPHGDYSNLDASSQIPLYITRKDSIFQTSPETFALNFLQAIRDLENLVISVAQNIHDEDVDDEGVD